MLLRDGEQSHSARATFVMSVRTWKVFPCPPTGLDNVFYWQLAPGTRGLNVRAVHAASTALPRGVLRSGCHDCQQNRYFFQASANRHLSCRTLPRGFGSVMHSSSAQCLGVLVWSLVSASARWRAISQCSCHIRNVRADMENVLTLQADLPHIQW